MNKLEIKSPVDILPELKAIYLMLDDCEYFKWESQQQDAMKARSRLGQLLKLIEKAGVKSK